MSQKEHHKNETQDVFLIEHDPSQRQGMLRLLTSVGYRVEAYASAEDFLRQPDPPKPACLILDLCLSCINGFDLQKHLVQFAPHLAVVFITGRGDLPACVRAMKNGAVDFLEKPVNTNMLFAAVEEALMRAAADLQTNNHKLERARRLTRLSPRERQVFDLVITGRLNKEIASELGISLKTVKIHRARVMQKTGCASIVDLVRFAL